MCKEELKIGLGIVAFDDTCHLKNIIAEVRDICKCVIVCLQKESWHGDPISPDIVGEIEGLVSEGLVDKVVWFVSENEYDAEDPATPRRIETDKRNYILDCLEAEGCTHGHIIDSDEFYDHDDYEAAVNAIAENEGIHVSYCRYINYYRDYLHVMVMPFQCYVPFVSDIKYRFSFQDGNFDKPSDPTRRYKLSENEKFCIFNYNTVKMHHLSWIRNDIREKIRNWSAKKYFNNMETLTERIIERYENYNDGENAVITFNVPENNVVIETLSEPYINPKYSLF